MAKKFEIKGPVLVKTGSIVLGQTDADDLPEWEEVVHNLDIHTNESGPELPAKTISHGRTAVVRVNLTDFDRTELDKLRKAAGAVNPGELGTLGADVDTFPITLEGATVGSAIFSFPICRIIEGIGDRQWGLIENKLFWVFESIPDPADLSNPANPYWTESIQV